MVAHVVCPGCGCSADEPAHTIVVALLADDADAAIDAGLLEASACPRCAPTCQANFLHARDARVAALAARERFRARDARLQRRAQARAAVRAQAALPSPGLPAVPGLPPAAAAALARARARAAGREPQ